MDITALVIGGSAAGQTRSVPENYRSIEIAKMPPARVTPPNHHPRIESDIKVEIYYLHEIATYARSFYVLHLDHMIRPDAILQELFQFYHDHHKDNRS